jgi:hypothetical protein
MKSGKKFASKSEVDEEPTERKYRLRHNMIVEGKLYTRGSVVAEELIPEKFRNDEWVSLVGTDNLVMLLREVSFMDEQVDPTFGNRTSHQVTLGKWSLVDLDEIPEETRDRLVEGTHWTADWNETERMQILASPYRDEDEFREMIGEGETGTRPLIGRSSRR